MKQPLSKDFCLIRKRGSLLQTQNALCYIRTLFDISTIYLIKTNLELFSPQQNRINLAKAKLTKPSFSIGKVGAFIASFGDSPPLFPLLQGFWEK